MKLFPPDSRQSFLLIVLSTLVLFFVYIGFKLFFSFQLGGVDSGNDSELYHRIAIGEIAYSPNLWGDLLAFLGDIGIYSREFVSLFSFIVFLLVAFLAPRLSFLGFSSASTALSLVIRCRWLVSLVLLLYPTLFVYTLDLYRDVPMAGLVILAYWAAYKFLSGTTFFKKFSSFLLFTGLSILLFRLRMYLGLAIYVSFFINQRLGKRRFFFLAFAGLLVLTSLYSLGLLDPIILYRGEDGFVTGSSSFKISLIDLNPLQFLLNLSLSFLFQIFGLYITTPLALLVFFVETIPFMYMLAYVIKNRLFMDRFSLYLFFSMVTYSLLVAMGNDNLGTALRLRVPVYLTCYILALRICLIRANPRLA